MVSRTVTSEAAPAVVWALLSQPSSWSSWAPQVRGGSGLGSPEVQAGCHGLVLIGPGFPVAAIPVAIGAVDPGHRWSWRVAGLVDMDHVVEAINGGGSRATIVMRAPRAIELGLRLAYAPLVARLLRRLARIAAAG